MLVMHLAWRSYTPLKVRLITDKETNKPRGYAFIEYMHTRDMKTAYKQADGRKLDNKRVLVDVERGRTVPNWRPRRLGGGLGSTRVGGEELNQKHSGREQQQIASGGPPRSEEPRVRDDRQSDRDREKSRERGRDKERDREKSREQSHDRIREQRDPRDDRHHRRDRDRDRYAERERDRPRDQDRVRSRDRGDRDRPRDRDHPRDREHDLDRSHDPVVHERDRGYRRGRDTEYDNMEPPVREREQPRDLGHGGYDDEQDWHNEPVKHRRERDYDYYEQPPMDGDPYDHHGLGVKQHEPEYKDRDRYDKLHRDAVQVSFDSEAREEGEAVDEHDYVYRRSERSLSREYQG